ncbi:UNVERIFIED_CONTAM: hypothetical protein Scaly_1936000 [Sesamum calycinum]|uniref:MULE transposase domain-containing protein n=1 Tax=Sesamum calycinum TaxID=2727403 RepID=A0AAW2NGR4_9LAMI
MIATHLLGMVRQDPAYDIKYVQQNVKDRFGFDISYHKAWHALKAAREEVMELGKALHSGIISAINFVPAFQFPRGVHRFCLRHICSNFNKKFNNIQLKDLCWRAGAEQNVRKFDRILEEIRGLNEETFNWLQRIDKAQWTLSHDGGWRTGISNNKYVRVYKWCPKRFETPTHNGDCTNDIISDSAIFFGAPNSLSQDDE